MSRGRRRREPHQASGKIVHAWAIEGDADPSRLRCNPFEIEWPRGSGRRQSFAEVDRAAWREKLVPAQVALVERLVARLAGAASPT